MAEPIKDNVLEKPVEDLREQVRKETASPPKRRRRALSFQLAMVIAVAAFAVLALFANARPYFGFDLVVTRAMQSFDSSWALPIMRAVSWAGFPPQTFTIVLLIGFVLALLGLRWEGVVSVLAALAASLLNVGVKYAVGRPRPAEDLVDVFRVLDSYSFPSGHVMFYVGFFGFLFFLAFTLLENCWYRWVLLALTGLMVLLVGPSRIYLGQHWTSDVLGAYLLGSVVLALAVWFYRWGKGRFFRHQPVAPEE